MIFHPHTFSRSVSITDGTFPLTGCSRCAWGAGLEPTTTDSYADRRLRLRIPGVGARIVAIHVAGQLVEQQHQRQTPPRRRCWCRRNERPAVRANDERAAD